MALANIVVTVTEPNVTVSSDNVNVSVSSTTTNVSVGNAIITTDSEIRAAISNTTPILYDSTTGVISFDTTGFNATNNVIINNGTTLVNATLSLGSNQTLSADAITDGTTNKFFTSDQANTWLATKTTDNLTEGSTNFYATTSRIHAGMSSYTGSLTNLTGNISTTANIDAQGGMTLYAPMTSNSNITTTANISASHFLGDVSKATGLFGNSNVITLLGNYSNVISTDANIVSTSTMFFGRDDNQASATYYPGTFKGISIGPETADSIYTPIFEFLGTRLYGNGAVVPNTDNYGCGKVTLSGTYSSGNVNTNGLLLEVGKNQDPGGLGSGGKHSGIQAGFYAQSTLGGTPGVYTDGGFRNTIDFTGDTLIRGPIAMGTPPGSPADENFDQAVITGINMYPLSLKVENNASVIRNFSAGSDVSNVHTFIGNVDITGNITASGNINYQNVTDLYVTDQKITLNANAATDATVEIIANRPVAGSNTVLRWNETSDIWEFTNDGSTFYPIPTSTSDLAEGTNLYYTDARVTAYTGGLPNLTGNITTSGHISTTGFGAVEGFTGTFGNIELSGNQSANTILISNNGTLNFNDNNGLITGVNTFNASNQINCLSGNIFAQKNSGINGFLGGIGLTQNNNAADAVYGYSLAIGESTPQGIISITQDQGSNSTDWHSYRLYGDYGTDDLGINLEYYRAEGSKASPTVVDNNDIIQQNTYYGHDGTQFFKGARDFVYHDTAGGAASSNAMNLTREFTSQPSISAETSRLRLCANGTIQFNTNGVKELGTNGGNASIALDGTITTVANVTATGNISGNYILGNGSLLTGIASGLTNAQALAYVNSSGLTLTANSTTNSNVSFTGTNKGITLDATGKLHFGDITGSHNPISSYTAGNHALYYITEHDNHQYNYEYFMGAEVYAGSSSNDDEGIMNNWSRGRGTLASPSGPQDGDKVIENNYLHYADTLYPDVSNYGHAGNYVYYDEDIATYSDTVMPLTQEFWAFDNGAITGTPVSIMKIRPNRHVEFNAAGITDAGTTGLANITADGSINSNSAITAVGNITGSYIKGNGSELTGISTTSFGTVTVAGETNIQASQGNAVLDIASSGAITLSTSGNTLTIGGSGSGYGNAEVTSYLATGTSTGNVAFTGNLIVESGNISSTISVYNGSVATGNTDEITFSSDPGLYSGQPITFSGTINSDLVFLNGNTYYVQGAGGGVYRIFTDAGTTTGLTSGLGSEAPNSLVGATRNESNNRSDFFGNVHISSGSALHTSSIQPSISGGTFSMTGLRASDVGLGSGGNNYFMPETGGTTEGAILTAHSDGAATWQVGLDIETDDVAPEIIKVQNSRSDSRAIENIYKRSRGTTASPSALNGGSGADRVWEVEYYGYDGNDYEESLGEHVYVDTAINAVSTGVMPLTKEIYCRYNGVMANSPTHSLVKYKPNGHVEFNTAAGTRGYGTQGNANIQLDGSIYSASTVDALNVSARQFVQLKNYTTTEINALSGMAAGDVVYNTTIPAICVYNGTGWRKINDAAM